MALAPEGIDEVIAGGRLNGMALGCKRWFAQAASQFDERVSMPPLVRL
jgi:hypothetical protein